MIEFVMSPVDGQTFGDEFYTVLGFVHSTIVPPRVVIQALCQVRVCINHANDGYVQMIDLDVVAPLPAHSF